MKKLLFIKQKDCKARWIDNDLLILRSAFKVKLQNVYASKGIGMVFALLFQLVKLLFTIHRYQLVFIWFADYHSLTPVFLCKLFGKKSIVVIGGYDADEILINEADSFKKRLRRFCVKYTIKNSNLLLPVSKIIKEYLSDFVNPVKCEVIYNCVNENIFNVSSIPEKENLVITVGGGGKFIKEAKRKQLPFFLELGNEFNELYPEYKAKFYAIGHDKDSETFNYLKQFVKSENVELKPLITDLGQLMSYFKRASIYMQLSLYESFGIAQAEAMLYGCIPVSNPGGAIPEVVGDAGFLIKDYERQEFFNILKEILDKKHEGLRPIANNRVISNFSLKTRSEKLLNTIDKLLEVS